MQSHDRSDEQASEMGAVSCWSWGYRRGVVWAEQVVVAAAAATVCRSSRKVRPCDLSQSPSHTRSCPPHSPQRRFHSLMALEKSCVPAPSRKIKFDKCSYHSRGPSLSSSFPLVWCVLFSLQLVLVQCVWLLKARWPASVCTTLIFLTVHVNRSEVRRQCWPDAKA